MKSHLTSTHTDARFNVLVAVCPQLIWLVSLCFLVIPVSEISAVTPEMSQRPLTVSEWSVMSPKQYMEATGVKLKFKDRLAHRYLTKKARKAIKKGALSGKEPAPDVTKTGWGLGFILGLLTGIIGVIVSIILSMTDKSGNKKKIIEGALIGVMAQMLLALIFLAIFSGGWGLFTWGN